jgi:3-dehydroquinate synthase
VNPDGGSRSLAVELGERSYPIDIGPGMLARAGERLRALGARRAIVVTNATVARHHMAPLRTGLQAADVESEAILVPDGETYKNWATLDDILTRLLELKAERSTFLIALGGGVVGDLTGFAAAIYQRGMPYVQVPTTLLAQVDSSVGGKTAVNHPLGKNMIGAFYQPRAVLIDLACLDTLPARELAAGLAEVIKYGAIRDAGFFAWLENNMPALRERSPQALAHAIHESCRIKAEIVGADERETGERALLNFGHTFGHAIETAAGYGSWLHGEAVAAGMVIASRVSQRARGLDAGETARIVALVRMAGLPVEPPAIAHARWLELMGRDKKVERGAIRFVLLDTIGRALVTERVTEAMLAEVLA